MKGLTKREEDIMSLFWARGPMFVKELIPFFDDPKPHFNTVSTIVRGLEEKGLVGHEVFGNSFRYFAQISESEYGRRTLKSIVSRYFSNSYLNAVSSLVEEEKLSMDDLEALIEKVKNSDK